MCHVLYLDFSRFATEEYTTDIEQAQNNFIHLTNYSINKDSDKFVETSEPEKAEVKPIEN